MTRTLRRLLPPLAAAATLLLGCSATASAGTFPLTVCGSSARDPGDGLSWSGPSTLSATAVCPAAGLGLSIYTQPNKTASDGATGAFKVSAPAGITVYSIHVVGAIVGDRHE